jgi:biopolymer transport protein ExbB
MPIAIGSALDNTVNFFVQGGFFMLLLVLLSIGAGAVMILRGLALREKEVIPAQVLAEIERLAPGDGLDALQSLAKTHDSALARVVTTLINHLNWPRAEAIEAVQTRARHEVARLESGLIFLEISTGVAPILGLLGTLSGLVGIFANLGGGGDPVGVAKGIAEALNTTIVGLGVAAPSLIAHNYFTRKIEMMAISMESASADLLAKCYPQQPG